MNQGQVHSQGQSQEEQHVFDAMEGEDFEDNDRMADVFYQMLSTFFSRDNLTVTDMMLALNENMRINNQIQQGILESLQSISTSLANGNQLPATAATATVAPIKKKAVAAAAAVN